MAVDVEHVSLLVLTLYFFSWESSFQFINSSIDWIFFFCWCSNFEVRTNPSYYFPIWCVVRKGSFQSHGLCLCSDDAFLCGAKAFKSHTILFSHSWDYFLHCPYPFQEVFYTHSLECFLCVFLYPLQNFGSCTMVFDQFLNWFFKNRMRGAGLVSFFVLLLVFLALVIMELTGPVDKVSLEFTETHLSLPAK